MRLLARVLVGLALLRVWQRITRTHRSPSPVAPAAARNKSIISPRLCAVCRDRRATDGDVCDGCSVWITALAYANRDASEHVS